MFFVVATTSARTRVSICCTSSPGVPIWRDNAAENGLLAPSPSSATLPGAVAKAISVPAPELIILTRSVIGSYVWKRRGTIFVEGALVKDEHYVGASQVDAYVKALLSPASGWSIVREDDAEVLFQRKP